MHAAPFVFVFISGDSEKPYLVKEVETLYKAAFDKNSTGVVKYEELKNLTLLKYSEGQMQLLTSKPYPNVACHIHDILSITASLVENEKLAERFGLPFNLLVQRSFLYLIQSLLRWHTAYIMKEQDINLTKAPIVVGL